MNAGPDADRADRTPFAGRMGSWIGLVSAAVTVALTVLNAFWSNRISTQQLALESELERQRLEIDVGRGRLERFGFAQRLLEDLLDDVEPARSLKVNLVNLALTEAEAQSLWRGLQASPDTTVSSLGATGVETNLARLVARVNAPVRGERLASVQELIDEHASNQQAVQLALSLLEEPRVATLSASGRINVLVFLQRTDPAAWTDTERGRAAAALEAMRARDRAGTAPIGDQTREALEGLERHLAGMDGGG